MKLTKDKQTKLDKAIEKLIEDMASKGPETQEYSTMATNLEVLMKAKANEKAKHISPDTIAIIAGNLLGIGLILGYERLNVISTKAMGFVMRGRV